MPFSDSQQISHIKELQHYLYKISQNNSNVSVTTPSGIYDSRTREAVKTFQLVYGLPVTAEADRKTWDMIVKVYNELVSALPVALDAFPGLGSLIEMDDTGLAVLVLQGMLDFMARRFSNVPAIKADGFFGEKTMQSVKRIQEIFMLEESGAVDMATWNLLTRYINHVINDV